MNRVDEWVLPDGDVDADVVDPAALELAERLLLSHGCPRRASYSPSELYEFVTIPLKMKGSVRSWQRACANGDIFALKSPGGRSYTVPWFALVRHLAKRQNAF